MYRFSLLGGCLRVVRLPGVLLSSVVIGCWSWLACSGSGLLVTMLVLCWSCLILGRLVKEAGDGKGKDWWPPSTEP